ILKSEMPATLAGRVGLVDEAIAIQDGLRMLDQDPTVILLGRDAFGDRWKGSHSDWSALALIVTWDNECREDRAAWDHRGILSRLEQPDALQSPLRTISANLKPASDRLRKLAQLLSLDFSDTFGVDSPNAVPI